MPTIFDAFPFHNEFDILECRLYELQHIPNVKHVLVEATVTHQDKPKPLYYMENKQRFARWADRIVHVVADGLPTLEHDPDPWARELAQRTFITVGLQAAQAQPDDILMHSDVDEIPRAIVVRNLRPDGIIGLQQRGHFWAIDWLHPDPWYGTVVCRVGDAPDMPRMRSLRNVVKSLPNAGWHLSWLGGHDAAIAKVQSFCHPEVEQRIRDGIADDDLFYRHGWHADLKRMRPVNVDRSWPQWIVDGNAPASWYRPR